ncbi:hypothetical protein V8D89_006242 [Ganoderma adspersum]
MSESQEADVAQEVQDPVLTSAGILQPLKKRARKPHHDSTDHSETSTSTKRGVLFLQSASLGLLSGLMNMPLDIFFQIAAHLHPLDMLNLSRTSKLLRSIMLSKHSRSAWIASLGSVQGLPPCPWIMNEPFYAALLFDHYCLWCGKDHATWVDYAIRMRLCETCHKVQICRGSSILRPDEVSLSQKLSLVPCETGSDYEEAKRFILRENRTVGQKYHLSPVLVLIDEYDTLARQDCESFQFWVDETLAVVTAAHEHAVRILAWIRERELADIQTMSDRKSTIIERLQELGYSEDDFPDDEQPWEELMNQAVPLTDRIWNDLLPELEEQLALENERRAQEAFEERVNDRLDLIVTWYDEYIEENLSDAELNLMPNVFDARRLPSLVALAQSDDAQGDLSREAFLELTEDVLADAEKYKRRAQRELADILRCDSACWDLADVPADDLLQRYCAYFECYCSSYRHDSVVDGCTYLTYEQLHAHWRERHPDARWLCGDYEEEPGWDPMAGVPSFWPESKHSAPSVGKRALEAVGIPLDTRWWMLDKWTREGRLFCACEHPGMPLPEQMSWGKLLLHLLLQVHEHDVRLKTQMRLLGDHNPSCVLRDNHSLNAGDACCVKFLPEGADTAAASVRTTVSDSVRAEIETNLPAETDLAALTRRRVVPVCRICLEALVGKEPSWNNIHTSLPVIQLPSWVEGIMWHMQSRHGKDFEDEDILLF